MDKLLQNQKNIDSIFFYAINNDLNYLGFFYTANNIKYKKDYKDVDFKESVNKLIKVYNTLNSTKKINLIGDLTKDIIEGKITLDNNKIYNKTLLNTEKYDYLSMIDYIKLIIKHTYATLNINDINLEIFNIPITFYKYDNGYKLKYRILKDDKDYLFDCNIKCFNKSIIVEINNKEYIGEIIFDKLNIDNSVTFEKDNKTIYYEYFDNDLTEIDLEKIKKVFKLINFDYEINGIKALDNNYILYNTSDEFEYYMKLSIHDELIRINLKYYNKFKKDRINFKPVEENYDYLITKYNDNNILTQQKYLLSPNSNYEFKQNINKSRYFILHSDNKINSIIESNITKIVELDYKIEDLNDIKKLTYKD